MKLGKSEGYTGGGFKTKKDELLCNNKREGQCYSFLSRPKQNKTALVDIEFDKCYELS